MQCLLTARTTPHAYGMQPLLEKRRGRHTTPPVPALDHRFACGRIQDEISDEKPFSHPHLPFNSSCLALV
jgi:hypothetical protein